MFEKRLAVLFLFFAIGNSFAQVTFKPGLRGGLSLSTISETHATYKADFFIGGFSQISLTKHYALQPEITYSRQGSNNVARNYYEEVSQIQKVEYRNLKLDYLSLTLINKFTFNPGVQVQFGPALDVLLNDNLIIRKEQNDLGFVVGVAYCLSSSITFEARFKQGFFDVLDSDYYYNDKNNYYFFGDYNTNNNFQIGISYLFGK